MARAWRAAGCLALLAAASWLGCKVDLTVPPESGGSIQLTVYTAEAHTGDLEVAWKGDHRGDLDAVPTGTDFLTSVSEAQTKKEFQNIEEPRVVFELDRVRALRPGKWDVEARVGSEGDWFDCHGHVKIMYGDDLECQVSEASRFCTCHEGAPPPDRHDVAIGEISAESDHPQGRLLPGDPAIRLLVTARNLGSRPEGFSIFPVEPFPGVITPDSITVPTAGDSDTLPGGGEEAVTFTWDTSALPEGQYLVRFQAGEVAGEAETGDLDNNRNDATIGLFLQRGVEIVSVAVVPEQPLRLDPPQCGGSLEANVTVTVRNYGDVQEAVTVTVETDPGGLAGSPQALTLAPVFQPGNTAEASFAWVTGQLPEADFDAVEVAEMAHDYTIGFGVTEVPGDWNTANNHHTALVTVRRDRDCDGVADIEDKCLDVINPPIPILGQPDHDKDGIGQECDFDYDQNGTVGLSDRGALLRAIAGIDPYHPVLDSDGSGDIDNRDTDSFDEYFQATGGAVARSGLVACADPTLNTDVAFHDSQIDATGNDPYCQ
jgi:hypothetical protein